jgi:hypothetical protein
MEPSGEQKGRVSHQNSILAKVSKVKRIQEEKENI